MSKKEDRVAQFLEEHGYVVRNALELNLNDLSTAMEVARSHGLTREIAQFTEGMSKAQAALDALDELEEMFGDER